MLSQQFSTVYHHNYHTITASLENETLRCFYYMPKNPVNENIGIKAKNKMHIFVHSGFVHSFAEIGRFGIFVAILILLYFKRFVYYHIPR